MDYAGKILSQTTNFRRNERVCMALNKKLGLNMATDKRHTNVEKLRGREKTRYEIFNICHEVFINAYVTNRNEYVTEPRTWIYPYRKPCADSEPSNEVRITTP